MGGYRATDCPAWNGLGRITNRGRRVPAVHIETGTFQFRGMCPRCALYAYRRLFTTEVIRYIIESLGDYPVDISLNIIIRFGVIMDQPSHRTTLTMREYEALKTHKYNLTDAHPRYQPIGSQSDVLETL